MGIEFLQVMSLSALLVTVVLVTYGPAIMPRTVGR
jgi:hypothetical protein